MKTNLSLTKYNSQNILISTKIKFRKLLSPVLEFNKNTHILTATILCILIIIPVLIYLYLDANSTQLDIDIHPDYIIPNHTLKNLGLITFIGAVIAVLNFIILLSLTLYTFGLNLSFKQDSKIIYNFSFFTNLVFYYGVVGIFISVRRVPHYHKDFDLILLFSLVLFLTSLTMSIFNGVRWFKYVKSYKKENSSLHFENL